MPQLALRPSPRPDGGPALSGAQAMDKIGQHMARGEQVRIVLENLDGEKFVHYGTPVRAKRKSNSIGFGFDPKGRDHDAASKDPDAKPLPEQIGTLYTVRGDSRFVGVNNSTPTNPKQTYRVISVESAREFLEKQDPKERPELAAKLHPVSVMRYEIVRDPNVPQQTGRNTASPYYVEVYKKLDDVTTPDVDERSELLYRIPLMNGSGALHPGYIEGARPIGDGRWLLDVGAKWDHGLNKPVIAIKADYNKMPAQNGHRYMSGLVNLDRIVLDTEGWPVRAEMEVGADHTFERPKRVEPRIPSVDMSRFEVESNPYGRTGLPDHLKKPADTGPDSERRNNQGPRPSLVPGGQQQSGENPGQTQNPQQQPGTGGSQSQTQSEPQGPATGQSNAATFATLPKLTPELSPHFAVIHRTVEAIATEMGRSGGSSNSATMVQLDEKLTPNASVIAADGRVQNKSVPAPVSSSMSLLSQGKALVDGGAFWAFKENGVVAFMSRNSRQLNAYKVEAIDATYRDIYLKAVSTGVAEMQGKWFDVAVDSKTEGGKLVERISPLNPGSAPEEGFTRIVMQGTLTSSGEFIMRIPNGDNTHSYVGYSPSNALSNAHPPGFPRALRGRTALSGGEYDPASGTWSVAGTLPQSAPHYTALSNPSPNSGTSRFPLIMASSQGGPQLNASEATLSLLRETSEVHKTMTSLLYGDVDRQDVIASLQEARKKISTLSQSIDDGLLAKRYATYLSDTLLPSIVENLEKITEGDSNSEMGVATGSLKRIDRSLLDQSAEILGIGRIDAGRMKEFYELLSSKGFGSFDQDESLIRELSNVLDTKHVGIVVRVPPETSGP